MRKKRKKIVATLTFILTLSFSSMSTFAASTSSEFESELLDDLTQHQSSFTIEYTGNSEDLYADDSISPLDDLVRQVLDSDEYLQESWLNISYSLNGTTGNPGDLTVSFDVSYFTSADQEAALDSAVEEIIASLIDDSMTDLEKVKAIHDYIIENVTYEDTGNNSHAAYYALFDGKAVCQGYALLAYKLLTAAGINNHLISGYVNEDQETAHIWNLVEVDGTWYHMDVTWDDPIGYEGDKILYTYFLLTDDEIAADHTWTDSLVLVP